MVSQNNVTKYSSVSPSLTHTPIVAPRPRLRVSSSPSLHPSTLCGMGYEVEQHGEWWEQHEARKHDPTMTAELCLALSAFFDCFTPMSDTYLWGEFSLIIIFSIVNIVESILDKSILYYTESHLLVSISIPSWDWILLHAQLGRMACKIQ